MSGIYSEASPFFPPYVYLEASAETIPVYHVRGYTTAGGPTVLANYKLNISTLLDGHYPARFTNGSDYCGYARSLYNTNYY